MLKRILPLGAIGLLSFVYPYAFPGPPAPIAPDRDIATLVPEQALYYVEACGLGPVLEQGLEHPFVRTVLESEMGAALLSRAGRTPAELIALADSTFGRELLPALARAGSRGMVLAGTAEESGPKFVLVVLGDDAELLQQLLSRAFDLVEERFGVPGALDRPQRTVRGADFWKLGEELTIARRDGLLVVGNREGLVSDVLDLAAEPDALGITARPGFRELAKERANEPTLWGWADLEHLATADREGLAKLRALGGNPGAQALLGAGICALGTSDDISLWLTVRQQDFSLGARGTGVDVVAPLAPRSERFAPPPPFDMPDEVAQGLVYRDYGALMRHRVELFPPETLPKFSETLSNLALFFGGKDVGEEVLPRVSPWIQLVSRPIAFDEGRVPEIPLPGVALVAELDEPEVMGPEFLTAFQSVIGVINVDQAQKSGRMMQLRLQLEGDVQITSARFLDPGPADGVDIRYNLEPACAVAGGSLVLGTHADLVRAVVRQLAARTGERTAAPSATEELRLKGSPLAKAIADNFEALVMNKVLEDGVEYDQAKKDIGGLQLLVASIEDAGLSVDQSVPGSVAFRADVTLAARHPEAVR